MCCEQHGLEEPQHLRIGGITFRGQLVSIGGIGLCNSNVRTGEAVLAPGSDIREKLVVKSVVKGSTEEAMLRREIDILQVLGSSPPYILAMLGHGDIAGTEEYALVTRFASSGDLHKLIPKNFCIEELEARNLTFQVFSALAYLHERSIIHGDVKPPNVLLADEGGALVARLTDFGLATLVPLGATSVHLERVQGSHGYMATELIQKRPITFAVDLFAWGVVLFALLSSYPPFYPASQVEAPLEFDEACWAPISPLGRHLAQRLLQVSPAERGTATSWLIQEGGWLTCSENDLVGDPRSLMAPDVMPVHFCACSMR